MPDTFEAAVVAAKPHERVLAEPHFLQAVTQCSDAAIHRHQFAVMVCRIRTLALDLILLVGYPRAVR